MAVEPRNTRKSLSTRVRGLITIIVVIAVIGSLVASLGQLKRNPIAWEKVEFFWFLPAILASMAALHCAAWFWWQSMPNIQPSRQCSPMFAAFFWSQLGKYVPGKAMVVVIRTTQATAQGVPMSTAIASTFLETLLWLAVGSAVSAVGLAIFFPVRWDLTVLALGVFFVFGWATFPPVFDKLVKRLTPTWSRANWSSDPMPQPAVGSLENDSALTVPNQPHSRGFHLGWRKYFIGVLAMLLGWILVGMSTWCIYRALPDHSANWEMYGPLLTAIALATAVGFITLIPGGLGVRELVLLPLLAPRLGIDQAIALAIIARLTALAAELFSIGIWDLLRKRPQFPAAAERQQP